MKHILCLLVLLIMNPKIIKSEHKKHIKTTPKKDLKKTMTENYSWYFYRSDHLISTSSEFRDSRSFNGYNISHFHRNSAGFFKTHSKCHENYTDSTSIKPVHIKISNITHNIRTHINNR